MTEITTISKNLTKDSSGIWVARSQAEISYPSEGNEACFAVEDTSFWFRHRNNVISHLVKEIAPENTFFDIGGGNGCVSGAVQQAGIDVVLVEPGPEGARNALNRGVKTVVQSTLEDAGFSPGSLPSIGLFDVLEHIQDDDGFLQAIHRNLATNGRLFMTVPAYDFLWSVDDDHAGHFRRYTTKSLSKRLESAGFEITYCTYLFSFLVPPILLMRSLPSRLGLRKSITATTTQKEHSAARGSTGVLMGKCLDWELNQIKKRKQIAIGSSCLAVATKMAGNARR